MVKFRVVVRFLCLGIFLCTTFSITISWRSFLSLVAFLGKKDIFLFIYAMNTRICCHSSISYMYIYLHLRFPLLRVTGIIEVNVYIV